MGGITDYVQDEDVEGTDKLLGTDATGGRTRNFTLNSMLLFYIATGDWSTLPIVEPTTAGRIWNDAGTLKVSS